MSKRTDRRAAEREARKLAFQQLRQRPLQTSEAQILANQANAQLSSGPVTPEGKAISSRNNTRHGLTVAAEGDDFQVLGNESQAAYDKSLSDFRTEWKPVTATEHDLVNRLVMHKWLRVRALRLQKSLFDAETGELTDVKKFDLYRRYETSHERGFNKCLADMQRLRAFQLRLQNGFESQRRKNEEHELKMQRLKREETQRIQKITAAKPPKNTETQETHLQTAA